jgi:hypothetical protein
VEFELINELLFIYGSDEKMLDVNNAYSAEIKIAHFN